MKTELKQHGSSFTAANEFPYKIFRDIKLLESIFRGKILARHVQLSPTNKCNLKCEFCSCKSRDPKQEWSLENVQEITRILKIIGTKGVTITGGGEPFMFKYIEKLVVALNSMGMSVGIVSNGTIRFNEVLMPLVTWIRFSFSDDRNVDGRFLNNIEKWIGKEVDLAFSYVVTKNVSFPNLDHIVEIANKNNFTHVRIVSDILDPTSAKNVAAAKTFFRENNIDDSKVIYQARNSFTKGTRKCLISLLKPMIYSDGYVYPCCGSQYALSGDIGRMPERMRMGHYTDLPEIIRNQKYFEGNICDVCYYEKYNIVLDNLLEDIRHLDFI